jgi:AraC-like DNA-binding protein
VEVAAMTPGRPQSSDRFSSFAASDPAMLEQASAAAFNLRKYEMFGGRDNFHAEISRISFGAFEIFHSTVGARGEVGFFAENHVKLQFGFGGCIETALGASRLVLAKDKMCILSGTTEYDLRFEELESTCISIDEMHLRRKLGVLLGDEVGAAVRLAVTDNNRYPNIHMVRLIADDLVTSARMGSADISPLVEAEMAQTWMAALLLGTEHNYSHLLNAEPADAGLPQVRRAAAFLESNWDKPLLIEDLTAAVGIGARSLFRSFKKYKGVSPKAFLRMVRLRNANRLLIDAGRDTSVADIAAACGFNNAGHFAKDYRETFGEPPSATLARTRTLIRLSAHKRRADKRRRTVADLQ